MKKSALSILIISLLTMIGHFSFAQLGGDEQWIPACDIVSGETIMIQQSELVDDCCWEWDNENWVKRENCDGVTTDCNKAKTPQCWFDQFIEGGLDNTGTSFTHTNQEYIITFTDGTTCNFSIASATNWSDQVTQISTGLAGCMPWAVESVPYCTSGCGGLSAPFIDLPDMIARYSGFKICPGEEFPVLVEYTSDQRTTSRPLVLNTILSDKIYLNKCVECGEASEYGLCDTGEAFEPFCPKPCSEPKFELPEPLCSYETVELCEISPDIFTAEGDLQTPAQVVTSNVFLTFTVCGSDLTTSAITLDTNGDPQEHILTEGNFYGNCETLEPLEDPAPECPADAQFEEVCLNSAYGILDNSLWVGAGNHLTNGDNNGIDLIHADGSVTPLPTLPAPYFNNFMTQLAIALPDCKVIPVCANHTSPNGCNAGHVANLAQYDAYDAPTAPGDVQNNISNPAQSELWATGWLIECTSCESPIVRAEIRESNNATIVGAYKDINVYERSEKYYRSINCDGFYYKDCNGDDVALDVRPCCLGACKVEVADIGEEPNCPQTGVITPIGSRPITRTFGDIGNGNAGPHVINDFTGSIQLEACETGDFANNGIVSNAFDLGLTGTAPTTCITVDQTSACAEGTAFVLFQDTPAGGLALPAVSSGAGNWQNLGPYAYDSSTGTDVIATQLCYNTAGVDLEDLVFVGFGTGGFGSDTDCCDSYTLISDIAECESSSAGTCKDIPTALCQDDCFESAIRITRGRPNPSTIITYGPYELPFSEFIEVWAANEGKSYITNQNGTGDGTGSIEAHWICPAKYGDLILYDGQDLRDGLTISPNPYAEELGCESKEAVFTKLCQADIDQIVEAINADKTVTGVYDYCVSGLPVIYCIDGKDLTFYQNGDLLVNPKFHKCNCGDSGDIETIGDQEVCASAKIGATFFSNGPGVGVQQGAPFTNGNVIDFDPVYTVVDANGVSHTFSTGDTVTGMASGNTQSVTYTGMLHWSDGQNEYKCIIDKLISADFTVQ